MPKKIERMVMVQMDRGAVAEDKTVSASCGGAPLDIIKAYVKQQHRPE